MNKISLTRGTGTVRRANDDQDFVNLGLERNKVAQWEDGQRVGTAPGSFEWWYFDCHLEDGTTIVVGFYTKSPSNPDVELSPRVTVDITLSDGRIIRKVDRTGPEAFYASKEQCDVRIGVNRFTGDLHTYNITAEIDGISLNIKLVGNIPAWRPGTGHRYFSAPDGSTPKLFSWLPSVPQGSVTAQYDIGEGKKQFSGIGYHDHNWGDAPMTKLMHNWYWMRAKIGPYSTISSFVTAAEKYGYASFASYFLARDGLVVADDDNKVTFAAEDINVDAETGKPVADVNRYVFQDGDTKFITTYRRERTILRQLFADSLPPAEKAKAIAAGFDAAYLRFAGTATVEKFVKDQRVETFTDPAVWELMYLGHARNLPPVAV